LVQGGAEGVALLLEAVGDVLAGLAAVVEHEAGQGGGVDDGLLVVLQLHF